MDTQGQDGSGPGRHQPHPLRRPAGSRGRPRDEELTARLLEATVRIVAEGGLAALTVDALATRTGAGKAGIYRRWPDTDHLVADALGCLDLLPPGLVPTGTPDRDLRALLACFDEPLGDRERFVGAVVGAAVANPLLGAALADRLLRPLDEAVERLAHATSGGRVPEDVTRAVSQVVQALWLQRCCRAQLDADLSCADLVDAVLLPVLDARGPRPDSWAA